MINPKDSSSESYNFRLSKKLKLDFLRKANRYGKPSDILRELLQAFVDNRLTIQPDPKKETLYVSRTEN